ncbi:MAG: recombinase [Chloroflexi bacterium]|nr:recombinase [Chloroflexota bacterium]
MTDEYEQYERAGQAIREENASLLEDFSSWLRAKRLSDTTVKRHGDNIDFYINEFLLYEDATPPAKGVDEVGMFLGYWFIQKAMWASQSSMRSYAASLRKFYQFMVERGSVDQEALNELKARIKEDMPEWLETLRRYDDPSIKDPFDIGIF